MNKNSISLDQNRRKFIKNLSLGSALVLAGPVLSRCSNHQDSPFYKRFLNPQASAQPFFRWWWNGNRLSKDEIARELELMKSVGIGGVEINPIEMPEQVTLPKGNETEWLSDDWIEFLEYTIDKAKDLGMIVDLIVGTGWPFGGEFLSPEETIQGLTVENLKFTGPKEVEVPLISSNQDYNSEIKSIVLVPSNAQTLADVIDVSLVRDQVSVNIQIPEGDYTICILKWQNNFRTVMHGAPGGAGPVLDHFNKFAVEKYLNHMTDRIKQKIGKKTLEGIRAMFCDSIELNGANWTTNFEQIFVERRGYDILPYLPLLLTEDLKTDIEFEDELKRARYDYSLTLSELFTENFIKPFHNWCHENGTKSRYQAYGYPWIYTDLLDGNLIPDIPEGDQWLFNGGWQPYTDVNEIRYAIWNKYAASAGHLSDKKIISSEAMTNTSGVFKASLKYIKQATDLNIATGINHLVLHGFNYFPPGAEFPGWIRFGTYFNENNPWWQYLPLWSKYTGRLSQIFQDATPISQVAIMGPTTDIWSNHGLDRNPFNLEPWYLHALWQALNHTGYGCEYINERLLKEARLENGKIIIRAMQYEVLLLCDVGTMNSDVANQIEELTTQGARILLIGAKPFRTPEMIGALKHGGIVTKSIENAMNAGILTAPAPDKTLHKSPADLMKWAEEVMKNCGVSPGFRNSNPQPALFHEFQKFEESKILFLVNTDLKKEYNTSVSLGECTKYAEHWDPQTGKRTSLIPTKNNQIEINLHPLESILIVCEPTNSTKLPGTRRPDPTTNNFEIATLWNIRFKSVDRRESNITLEKLKPINTLEGYENFAGEIYYKSQFKIEKKTFNTLVIEEVHETAEVWLNGKNLGVSWYGNNHFALSNRLRKGKNLIEIKVTTLLANYCASLKDNKTAQYWTSRYKNKKPVNCGLIGKVTLS